MATKVYDTAIIKLIDGTVIEISPLKIKYLRQFMDMFEFVKTTTNDEEAMVFLSECATIAMQQYYPSIKTVLDLEDNVDMPTIYKIIDIAAGIKIDKNPVEQPIKEQAEESKSNSTWEKMDLLKLESEVFLLGIWKDYDDLERNLSMPELIATLEAKRELDYSEKKFLAAMQGVDLDKENGKQEENPWEKMKAKYFSNGKTTDPNDITTLQGANAVKAGFGIGMGLEYEDMTKK